MRSVTTRPLRGLPVLVAMIVAIQVAVPLLVLVTQDKPGRFGFQMFSGAGSFEASQITGSGERATIDVPALIEGFRVEVTWTERLPEYLCRRLPDAVSVTVTQNTATRSVRCER
jgi:hypothetical protein